MYCKKCGAEIDESQKFCPNCGSPIDEQQVESERINESSDVENVQSVSEGVNEFSGAENTQTDASDKADNSRAFEQATLKSNRTRNIIIVAIVVIVIALIAVLLIFTSREKWAVETETDYVNGELTARKEYQYNDKHTVFISIEYDSTSKYINSIIFGTVDKNGNNISDGVGTFDGLITDFDIVYDDKTGLITSCDFYNEQGDVILRNEYSYDDNGYPSSFVTYNTKGNISSQAELTYDKEGNKLSAVYYDGNGKSNDMEEYTYDNDGRVTNWTVTYFDGRTNINEDFTYDKKGNLVSTTLNGYKYEEYTYSEDGKLSSKDVYTLGTNDLSNRYTYTYDENGNLSTEKGIGADTTTKEYTYINY